MAALSNLELRKIAAHFVRKGHPIPGDCLKADLVAVVGQIDTFLEANGVTMLSKIDGKLTGLTNRLKMLLIAYVILRKVNELPVAEDN